MKYWWLEKYRNFKIIQINELIDDINYFLTMPKNYKKQYLILQNQDIESLEEEELLILLTEIGYTKNIKDNKLNLIINKLLKVPDNSFPESDYTLSEMLDEIKELKHNLPYQEKLENNNIAICYHCLNIFYIDKIKSVNQKNLCLCPFCHSHKLYFDNDYIPMNTTFIKLSHLYYHTSNLGCTFREIQKILKKCITTEVGKKEENSISFSNIFSNKKINPIDEKVISRKIYQELMIRNENLIDEVSIYISNLDEKVENSILMILLIAIMEALSSTVYLKRVKIVFQNQKQEKQFSELLKVIKKFH